MKRKGFCSIGFKITMAMVIDVTVIIVMLCLCNSLFFEKFYVKSKQKELIKTYENLSKILLRYDDGEIDKEEFENSVEKICSPNNISAIILKSDWVALYTTTNNNNRMKQRMSENILGNISEDSIITKNEKYTLQRMYDYAIDGDYYEIFGYIGSENTMLLRIPVKSIDDSVDLSNKFILYIGFFFIGISCVTAWFLARRLTKPIKKISELALSMSKLKFDQRYEDADNDEIAILGESLNTLNDALDSTICELKNANNELLNDIENKKKLEASKIDFVANVSHELKTPIALIQGYAEGLKEGVFDSPENAEYYCDVIIDESKKMNEIVKNLLTLNQLESKNDKLMIEKFNITELVNGIVESNRLRANSFGMTIDSKLDKPICVWADEYRIEEVVTNYISNAINHCDGEKVIEVDAIEKGNVVRINVRNTGKCIPESDLDKIWEKFYKVDKARTRAYGGNGIGLSIVRAIMELHNKDYGVNNLENGVEFWFELDTDIQKCYNYKKESGESL